MTTTVMSTALRRTSSAPYPGGLSQEGTALWSQFPPRPRLTSWPGSQIDRDALLARVLVDAALVDGDHSPRWLRRRAGLTQIVDWLSLFPGQTWQQRWLASGADALGNATWWHPLMTHYRPHGPLCATVTSSNLRVSALLLASADAIRPSMGWVLTPRAPQNLAAVMATVRDPAGFARLSALCDASQAGRTMKTAALRRVATILAVKGGTIADITVGDCLELALAVDGRMLRKNRAMGVYQLLHTMGVFGAQAPSTIRVFDTRGQLSPAQLIDRYGLTCTPVRDVLVAYLAERQPSLDYSTMQNLALSLGALFWADLERHHPGIDSLNLTPAVATAWKSRIRTRTRTITRPDGSISHVDTPREGALSNLAMVRAFYLDIAQWALEDPAQWGPWAVPCPIRPEDLARQKSIRARKSRMDQRTRERLPVLPQLAAHVDTARTRAAALLEATAATAVGKDVIHAGTTLVRHPCSSSTGRVWAIDPTTGQRRDLTGEEDRAFWTWAAVETLRHTGIRIEELTELSHHSLVQYTLPGTGDTVPLLQIAPSKTDSERLLVVSPELADVLAALISRNRGADGALDVVASYDPGERVWNPPMPLLFQRRFGLERRAIPAASIREWIYRAIEATGIADATGQPLRFTPHDFRRMFITDAVLHGMPPHIAQLIAGHRDINTTMGYKAVYPQESINAHRAFITRRRQLRPDEEYRQPSDSEWEDFLGHFVHRKVALGTCGRSYATACIHEHACVRCPLLRTDPGQRQRLQDIRDNLIARIAEARNHGWHGEVDGLQVSLDAAREKLTHLDLHPTLGCGQTPS
jgi:integrase-like protein